MHQLFQQAYNQNNFIRFLTNDFLTNDFEPNNQNLTEDITDIKTFEVFESLEHIGTDPTLGLDILVIRTTKANAPRIVITKAVHRLLGYYGYSKALVVFWNPDSPIWRLSLVTQSYEVAQGLNLNSKSNSKANSKAKIQRNYSNPKRFSFTLGEGIATQKTAQKYLISSGRVIDEADLLSRFSTEAINKEFYTGIKAQYDSLWTSIRLSNSSTETKKDKNDNNNINDKEYNKDRKDFALRLVGRLIFCWFLRAKGWMPDSVLSSKAVDINNDNNNNDNQSNINNGLGYYHNVLESIFFDTLNQPQEKRTSSIKDQLQDIPYLNGGLFEAKTGHKSDYYLPNQFLHNLIIPDNNIKSLLELFEQYHFTIDESSSTDQEIGIDPEMMGKIFENLILERSETGSFYTPREIVDYMVSSSLVESLKTQFLVLPQTIDQIINWVKIPIDQLQASISLKPNQKVIFSNSLGAISVSAYLIAKLRGQLFSVNTGQFVVCNAHNEITLEVWNSFLDGEFRVLHSFVPSPNKVNITQLESENLSILVPKIGYIININNQKYAVIGTIHFDAKFQIDTFYEIYEDKKITKLCGTNSQKSLLELVNYLKSKDLNDQSILKLLEIYVDKKNTSQLLESLYSSRMDAIPSYTQSWQSANISALQEVYRYILPNDNNLVKIITTVDPIMVYIKQVLDNNYFSVQTQKTNQIQKYLSNLKIFDPACGSGAFPMGILQKLTEVIHNIDPTRSIYDIKKTILENCIYGSDIMPIAVEISRLRCWLSLVVDQTTKPTQAKDRLPNLEFKFVCANSLIGIKQLDSGLGQEEIATKQKELSQLRKLAFQPSQNKIKLQQDWHIITRELFELQINNGFYDQNTGTDLTTWNPFDNESSPFFDSNWMFGVDGFDIVLGNPPYGATVSTEEKEYYKNNYYSAKTDTNGKGSQDTFVVFSDLAIAKISNPNAIISYIVPMSITSSDAMTKLHKLMFDTCSKIYISSYSSRPKKIFDSADLRVSILIVVKGNTENQEIMATKVNKRYSNEQTIESVIKELSFVNTKNFLENGRIPKISTNTEIGILNTLRSKTHRLNSYLDNGGSGFYYRTSGGRYYHIITNFPTGSSKEKAILLESEFTDLMCAIFSSNLYFWFYHIYSNNLDLKGGDIDIFPILDLSKIDSQLKKQIEDIYAQYLVDLEKNSEVQTQKRANVSQVKIYYARKSKHLIDKLDRLICPLYGLTQEQTDWIINFDIKFRTDSEE